MVELTNYVDRQIRNTVLNMFDKIQNTQPFNRYYNSIRIETDKNFIKYINNFLENNEPTYDILSSEKYVKFDFLPNPKYSTQDIVVYMRSIKELEKMLTYDYYTKFNFDTFVSYKYNPTLYNSEKINKQNIIESYILTPTITPHLGNIVVIRLDKNAYDFYFENRLFADMWQTYISLPDNYLVYNSIELGSLPEIYHYHIQKVKLTKPRMIKLTEGFYKIDGNISLIDNGDQYYNPYANMYCIGVDEIGIDNLLENLGVFLWKCRYVVIDDIAYKFSSQIFLYNFGDQDYLMFSFKKNKISNIRLVNESLSKEYYDDIYGDSYQKYGLIYLPLGIIICNEKSNPRFLDNDIIKSIKLPYVYHPTIEKIYADVFGSNKTNNKISTGTYLSECLKINNIFNTVDVHSDTKINCNRLPILYTYTDKYFDLQTECGLINIDNNLLHYIKNLNVPTSIIKLMSTNNNIGNVFVKYYGMFNNKSDTYMLFEHTYTNLDLFIDFEKDKLANNSNILNAFLLNIYYCVEELSISNYGYDISSLSDILVCKETRMIVDYNVNNKLIVSVSNNNTDFKINCNGYCLKLKMKKSTGIKTSSNNLYYNFVQLLKNKCDRYGITNLSLDAMINNRETKFNNLHNYFTYAYDIIAHRPPYYLNFDFYSYYKCHNTYDNHIKCIGTIPVVEINAKCNNIIKFNEFFDCLKNNNLINKYCSNTQAIVNDCTGRINIKDLINLIATTKNSINFETIIIPENTLFVSGTNNNVNDNIETYNENKYWMNQISYFAHISELKNIGYLSNLFSNYMSNNTTSRIMVFRNYAPVKIIKIQSDNQKKNTVSILNFTYNMFSDSSEFVNHYVKIIVQLMFNNNISIDEFNNMMDNYIRHRGIITGFDVFVQDVLNFCLKSLDSNIIGYTNHNPIDNMIEYIIFKPCNNFQLISVIKPFNDELIIFDSIQIFNNAMINYVATDYSNKVINLEKFNKSVLEILNTNNVINDNKKLFSYLMKKMYPIISDIFYNMQPKSITDDMFTKLISGSNSILYRFEYVDLVNKIDHKRKYDKYKRKYIKSKLQ
jgi:hypothetical protein